VADEPEAGEALTTADLSTQPDFQLTTPPPSTGADAFQAELETGAQQQEDEFTRQQREEKESLEKSTSQTLDELLEAQFGAKGEAETRAGEEDRLGLSDIGQELKDINNQLLREQVGLRREIERLEENKEGRSAGSVRGAMQIAQTRSLRRQADLSVIQMGIQGRFDSAKAIADRAVAIQMERQTNELAIRQFAYQENKEMFNKSEQRLFETRFADRERALEKEQANLQQISDWSVEALEGGASSDVVQAIRNAKTPDEALRIGHQFIGKRSRLEMSLLGLQVSKANKELEAFNQAVKDKEAGKLTEGQFKVADDLRKEYNGLQEVKDSKGLESNLTGLLLALDQQTGAGDIAAINQFQRLVVDPGVAVREGDVTLLQSANSAKDKAWLRTQGYLKGDKLTDTGRTLMRDLALGVYDARVAVVDKQISPIKTRATESGIDFDKYISAGFSSSKDLINTAKNTNPADNLLNSFDEVPESPEELSKEASNFWGGTSLSVFGF